MKKNKYLIISILALFVLLFFIPDKYEEVETASLLSGSGPIEGIYTHPYQNQTSPLCITNIHEGSPISVYLKYDTPISFDGLSIYFPGNTHSITSFAPKYLEVDYKDGLNWKKYEGLSNIAKPYFKTLSEKGVTTDEIVFRIDGAFSKKDKTVCLEHLQFLQRKDTGLFQKLQNFMKEKLYSVSSYITFYTVFLIILFTPGFVFLNYSKKQGLDEELKVILSPIVTIFFMMFLTVLYLLSGVKAILWMLPAMTLFSVYIAIRYKLYKNYYASKEMFLTLAISLFVTALIISKRDVMFNLQYLRGYLDSFKPIPMDGYTSFFVDNRFPWGIARLYLHRTPLGSELAKFFLIGTTVFERTPGLPMIVTPILNIFGESHFIYQRYLEVLTAIYFGSIYFTAKRIFSKKVAQITALLVLANVQLLYIDFNTELFYKYIAIYPALIATTIYFSKVEHKNHIIGILLGVSFLIHPSTLVIVGAFGLVYLLDKGLTQKTIREFLPTALIVGILFLGWYLAPKFLTLDKFSSKQESLYFKEALQIDRNIFYVKATNAVALFFPNPFMKDVEFFSWTQRFQFLRYSLIANFTPMFFIVFVYIAIKRIKKDYPLLILIISPLIIYWAIYLNRIEQYYNYGGAYFLLFPFVLPLGLMYTTSYLIEKTTKSKVLIAAFITYVITMCIAFFEISGVFRSDLSYPSPVPKLEAIIIFLVFLYICGLLIWKTLINDKKLS